MPALSSRLSRKADKRKAPQTRSRPKARKTNNPAVPVVDLSGDEVDEQDMDLGGWVETNNASTRTAFTLRLPTPSPSDSVNPQSSALDCLRLFLTDNVLDQLIENTNSYAQRLVQLHTPPTRKSMFREWSPVTRYDFLKYLAILINIGKHPRPCFKDCWSTKPHKSTPWYSNTMRRDRVEAIHHTMLHCSESEAEGKEKN